MMNAFKKATFAGVLALGTTLVAADGPQQGPEFHLGLMMNTGNDIKAMKKGSGWTASLGYNVPMAGDMVLHPHLTTIVFEGVEGSALTNKRPTFMMGLDVKKPLTDNLYAIGGFMGVKWNQGAVPTAADFKNNGTVTTDLGGIKLGLRAGLAYAINDQFSVEAVWHVAEANKRFVPSWLAVGASIRY